MIETIEISLLGSLINIIDGREVEQYMRDEIWEPLGMKNTGFFIHDTDPNYQDKVSRVCKLYVNIPKIVLRFIGSEIPFPPIHQAASCIYEGPRSLPLIDSGMYTTVADYLKFMKMYLNDGKSENGTLILSPTMIDTVSTYHIKYDVSNLSTVSGYSSGLSVPIIGAKSEIKRKRLLSSMRWGLGVGTIQGCKNNPYADKYNHSNRNSPTRNIQAVSSIEEEKNSPTGNIQTISSIEGEKNSPTRNIQAISWAGVLGTRFLIDFCSRVAYNAGTNVVGPPAGMFDSDLIELNYKELDKEGYKRIVKEMLL